MSRYSDLLKQRDILTQMYENLNELKRNVVLSRCNSYVDYNRFLENFFIGLNSDKTFFECDGDLALKEKTFNTWYEALMTSLENQVEKIDKELDKFERVKDGIEFLRCMKQKFIKNCSDGKEYDQFATGLRIAYMDIKEQNKRLNINANDKDILELLEDMEYWLEGFMDMKSGVE